MAGRPFGEIAVSLGYLSVEQLHRGLAEQKRRRRRQLLGILLVELGYMTPGQACRVMLVQEAEEQENADLKPDSTERMDLAREEEEPSSTDRMRPGDGPLRS